MQTEKFRDCVNSLNSTLTSLSQSLMESRRTDRELVKNLHIAKSKNDTLTEKLKESENEKAELLDIFNNKSEGSLMSSKVDLSDSRSTMSIVHLQYKYEELLSSHNGLLKVLDLRTNEIRKCSDENIALKEEIEHLKLSLEESKKGIAKLLQKLSDIKQKKRHKIIRLQQERDSLKAIHNQLIVLLHNKCMERDDYLLSLIQGTSNSDRALLLQEVRKNNLLSYEAVKQQQELDYLRSILKVKQAVEQQIH